MGAIFEAYTSNILSLAGYSEAPMRDDARFWSSDGLTFNSSAYSMAMQKYNMQQTAYISNITSFASKLLQGGNFEEVLTDCATTFFGSTISTAVQGLGTTVGGYFSNMLATNSFTWKTSSSGRQYAEVDVIDSEGNNKGAGRFEYVTDGSGNGYWNIIGKLEEGDGGSQISSIGEVGFDEYGGAGYVDAEIEEICYGLWRERQYIENGYQTYADVTDLRDGSVLLRVNPNSGSGHNVYSGDGYIIDGSVETNGWIIINIDGEIYEYTGNTLPGDDPEVVAAYIRQVAPIGYDPDDFVFTVKKTENGYKVSTGLADPSGYVAPELKEAFTQVTQFVKNSYLSFDYIVSSTVGKPIIKSYNNYVYSVLESGYGRKTKEVHYNGLHFIGDTSDDIEIARDEFGIALALGYTLIRNGEIRYDIDPYTKESIIVRIENYEPVSIKYDGRAADSLVKFTGIRLPDGTLGDGTLEIMGKYVINIIGGQIYDFFAKNDPLTSHWDIDYGTIIALLTEIQVPRYQFGLPGIFNSAPNGAEADFEAAMQEIFNARNKLNPRLTDMFNQATFCNSENSRNIWQLFYNNQMRYCVIRDLSAVRLNMIFRQLDREAYSKFKNFESLYGMSFFMESGGKAPGVGYINMAGLRSYSAISISGNMSMKLSNPYAKFFVNFTSNNEVTDMFWPVPRATIFGIDDNIEPSEIFLQPDFDKQVWNIQFDDDDLNLTKNPDEQYMHVDYARKPKHEYHGMFIALSSLAEYAAIDGGSRFKNALMDILQVDQDGLDRHIISHYGKIVLGQAEAARWNAIKAIYGF